MYRFWRLFARLGRAQDPSAGVAFVTRALLVYGAVRSSLWTLVGAPLPPLLLWTATAGHLVALALRWSKFASFAVVLALVAGLLELFGVGVNADNHFALELLALALLAGAAGGAGARGTDALTETLGGLRALVAVVLFHTGLAKIWTGLWDQGEFLAYMIGHGERFGVPFSWLVGAEQIARLAAYDTLRSDVGPYLVPGVVLPLASMAVVAAELTLPLALMATATRRFAIQVSLVFVLCLQVLAQEFGFAALFSILLWSFGGNRAGARSLRRTTVIAVALLTLALWAMDATGSFDRGNL
ncbi:MAG: hypothetical protein ACI8TX_002075 [Hyphomicrobiaceae bacterium]|jgi:hypothetical protein